MQQQSISIPQESLLFCISTILEEILAETDNLESPLKTMFHAPKKPAITINSYLQRIGKYCGCSDECYILALIYLDRIQEINQDIVINSLCVHRFLMTAVVIGVKYHDDEYYKNEFYAKVGGIPKLELNKLEQDFLEMIEYQVHVDLNIFENYKTKILTYAEM